MANRNLRFYIRYSYLENNGSWKEDERFFSADEDVTGYIEDCIGISADKTKLLSENRLEFCGEAERLLESFHEKYDRGEDAEEEGSFYLTRSDCPNPDCKF